MSNTATAQTALPIQIYGIVPITPVVVSIDTINTDLTVFTPDSDKMACIIGMVFAETNATNLTIKSGSTTNLALELAANQGMMSPIGDGIIWIGQPGQALVIQASATITSMLFYVGQIEKVDLS